MAQELRYVWIWQCVEKKLMPEGLMTPGPTLAQTESLLNLAINSSVACHAKTELRPGLELKLGFCGTWEVKSRVRVSLAPNTFHFQGCISVLGNPCKSKSMGPGDRGMLWRSWRPDNRHGLFGPYPGLRLSHLMFANTLPYCRTCLRS